MWLHQYHTINRIQRSINYPLKKNSYVKHKWACRKCEGVIAPELSKEELKIKFWEKISSLFVFRTTKELSEDTRDWKVEEARLYFIYFAK